MLIDQDRVEITENTSSVVRGVARDSSDLLEQGELVLRCVGLNTYFDYVEKNFTEPKREKASSKVGKSTGGGFFSGNDTFHEFNTYEETVQAFRHNPTAFVKYDPAQIYPREFMEPGNDVDYDVVGDFIDIGRFVEGAPESMGVMHNGKARSRRVRILVDNTHAWYVSAPDLIRRGERIIRLIDALENANVRTEFTTIDSAGSAHIEVVVKKFDEPLTLEDIAVATHPDMLRRISFRVDEHSATWKDGYGDSYLLKSNFRSLRSDLNDELTILITGVTEESPNFDKGFNELETLLEEELSNEVPTISMIKLDDKNKIEKINI